GNDDGAAARMNDGDTDDAMARLGIATAPHLLQGDGEIAGHAGNHGVGVAKGYHAGRKDVAVLVYHPLTVAEQISFALQPLIKIRGIIDIALRETGVDNLDRATAF